MKKYRLKKELPGVPSGTVYIQSGNFYFIEGYCMTNDKRFYSFYWTWLDEPWFPEWFEEVKE